MKLKKCIAMLIAALLILGCFPISALAANDAVNRLTPEAADAYAQVLRNLQATYGEYYGNAIYYTAPNFHDFGKGVAYAELVDFDGDGRDELLVGYVSPDHNYYHYCLTVWTCTEGQSTATCLYNGDESSEFQPYDGLPNCYLFRSGERAYLYGFQNYQHHTIWNHEAALYAVSPSGLSAVDEIREVFIPANLYYCYINDVKVAESDIDGNAMEWGSPEPGSREARDFYAKYPTNAMTQLCFWEAHDEESDESESGTIWVERKSWAHNDVSGLIASLELKALEGKDASAVLAAVPYYGDRNCCKMGRVMALAFADVIRRDAGQHSNALLADVSGDGYPILILYTPDTAEEWKQSLLAELYHFVNGEAQRFEALDDNPTMLVVRHALAGSFLVSPTYDAKTGLYSTDEVFFRVRNGAISPVCTLCGVFNSETNALLECYVNGAETDPDYYTNLATYYAGTAEDAEICSVSESPDATVSPENIAALLEIYAEKVPSYVMKSQSKAPDEYEEEVSRLAEEAVGGTVSEVLRLSADLYYVTVTAEGREKGVLIKGITENGLHKWSVLKTYEMPVSPETLDAFLMETQSKSNLRIDFSRAFGSQTEVASALEEMLLNVDGIEPNDAAKQELAEFVETAVASAGTASVKGDNNRISISGESISSAAEKAFRAEECYRSVLETGNITLNREPKIVICLVWTNAEIGKPCQISLDASVLDALKGADLQIYLTDQQHYLELSSECLNALLSHYDCFNMQIQRENDVYLISFLNKEDGVIDEISDAVTIALPCKSRTGTVMAHYSGISDNWGGQFDQVNQVLSFATPFSGRYEVVENKLLISDISDLDEETQTAIYFMTAKGFFCVEDGMFRPHMMLNRYDFCQTLVTMFFSLNRSLSSDFKDVPSDSSYYSYVASGQQKGIIQGYDDGTFKGKALISMQEMLSLSARTLTDQKHYNAPADMLIYLNRFSDGVTTSEWARSQTALAIREGLVNGFPALNPTAPVAREEAAVVLYRLFLLLDDTTPVEWDFSAADGLAETDGENAAEQMPSVVMPAVCAACSLCGAAVCIILLRKKRR